jgi:hypothetical protein
MHTITASVRALIYNDTKYCMESMVRNNVFKYCRQIPNADLNERAVQILWQVNKTFKKSENVFDNIHLRVSMLMSFHITLTMVFVFRMEHGLVHLEQYNEVNRTGGPVRRQLISNE